MITDTTTLYLYVETALHAGVGAGLSSIDLPIQRERTTQYPTIQGSGIKGKLRAVAEGAKESFSENDIHALFGPRDGNDHAGALIIGDARILLFPVRSLNGVFAYATSRDVLHRFKRDTTRNSRNPSTPWEIPNTSDIALVTTDSTICIPHDEGIAAVLEEFTFIVEQQAEVSTIAEEIARDALPNTKEYEYWRQKIVKSLIILPENDFRDFVLYSTEIITRVKLEQATKTVKDGLWTEEHLPADTLLYVPVYATNSRKDGHPLLGNEVVKKAQSIGAKQGGYLQLGGDETVGRGMVRIHWATRKI